MQRTKTKIHALRIARKKDLDDQRETDVNDWNRGKPSGKRTIENNNIGGQ